jgi:nitrogenase molybdenum-iron protein alpha/beta subunit
MNYIVDNDRCSLKIAELVKKRLDVPVDTEYLPVGIKEYKAFSEKIGKEFNIPEKAAKVYADEEKRYYEEIKKIRPKLEGKKVLIENRFLQDIDWLIELLSDLGMEIVLIEMGPLHPWKEKGPESKYLNSGIKFKHDYNLDDLTADIQEYSPDIVLADGVLRETENVFFSPYSNPGPGLNGVLNYGNKLKDLMHVPKTEGWRNI